MDQGEVIEALAARVRQQCAAEGSHDWWHVWRVWRLARRIALAEGADSFICEVAALCHDLEDWKYSTAPRIRPVLSGLGLPDDQTDRVTDICSQVSFKGAGVPDEMPTLEGKVVQDADRLDAIGAVGVARAFAYGGAKGRPLHNPEAAPELHASFEAYRASTGSSLAHFPEKLFLLKDRLHTETARQIARERHEFMEAFVDRFLQEWDAQA